MEGGLGGSAVLDPGCAEECPHRRHSAHVVLDIVHDVTRAPLRPCASMCGEHWASERRCAMHREVGQRCEPLRRSRRGCPQSHRGRALRMHPVLVLRAWPEISARAQLPSHSTSEPTLVARGAPRPLPGARPGRPRARAQVDRPWARGGRARVGRPPARERWGRRRASSARPPSQTATANAGSTFPRWRCAAARPVAEGRTPSGKRSECGWLWFFAILGHRSALGGGRTGVVGWRLRFPRLPISCVRHIHLARA